MGDEVIDLRERGEAGISAIEDDLLLQYRYHVPRVQEQKRVSGEISAEFGRRIDKLLSELDFIVPYQNEQRKVPQNIHAERGRRIYRWALAESIFSSSELEAINQRQLTFPEFCTIWDRPEDAVPLATAKGMSSEQHDRFVRYLTDGTIDRVAYQRNSKVWVWTGISNFMNSNGRRPDFNEEFKIVEENLGQFKAFVVFKNVLGENVSYDWADEAGERIENMRRERGVPYNF